MKILSAHSDSTIHHSYEHPFQHPLDTLKAWVKDNEEHWEFYRFGITAAGVFVQVTFGAIMVATLGLAGANPWMYIIGVSLAFAANSIAFAQSPMRIVLGLFVVSIVVNLALTLFYAIPMLLH